MERTGLKQKELIGLLAEIYNQLEELDQELEKHLTDYRQDLSNKHRVRLSGAHHQLLTLERSYKKEGFQERKVNNNKQDMKFQSILKIKPSY